MTPHDSHRPILSVGLPVYNGLPYLRQSLDSMLDQDLDDLEIVVCDNASTDDTEALVRRYAGRDPRVRYFRNDENIGASRNYIKSFELSRGKYFRWSASDDYVSRGVFKACVDVLEENPELVLAWPQTRVVDQDGKLLEEYDDGGEGWSAPTPAERFWCSLEQWGYCNVVFGVMRREVLGQTVLLGDYPASDLVWQSDMAIRGPFRQVKGEYYYRRMHSGVTDNMNAEELAEFYEPTSASLPEPDKRLKRNFNSKHINFIFQLARVIGQSPVGAGQKAKMYTRLARKANWSRSDLIGDVKRLLSTR